MARDITKRLTDLHSRRSGSDRLNRLGLDEQAQVLAKSLETEQWQSRASGKPYTQYALGSMRAVEPNYTRISRETADRWRTSFYSRLQLKASRSNSVSRVPYLWTFISGG